jgi:AAA ATPase domain
MDAMQFGRWISERRRARGWTSQRTLLGAVEQDAVLSEAGISEDFIARLEAGQLAYPFRGRVRRRVLLLARLLCASPTDLRGYLRAAGMQYLSPTEDEEIASVRATLAARSATPPYLLPRRPARLVGREAQLDALLQVLTAPDADLCCVSGMPGVGKSTLVYEAIHRLASNANTWLRRFPDGVAVFSCTGRRGTDGLISLLDDICAVFVSRSGAAKSAARSGAAHGRDIAPTKAQAEGAPLARALDRTRRILAQTRALIVLDDLDPRLPLEQALDALLIPVSATEDPCPAGQLSGACHIALVTTSRHVPVPTRRARRLLLAPLAADAAHELFVALLECPIAPDDRDTMGVICAALGHLPLALELAATAVTVRHIPLAVLAVHLREHPLDQVLDGDGELHARIDATVDGLDGEARRRFALLSALGAESFSLEAAATLGAGSNGGAASTRRVSPPARQLQPSAQWERGALWRDDTQHDEAVEESALALAAADLGTLVRYSLLEADEPPSPDTMVDGGDSANERARASATRARYRIHPLLRAYATNQAAAMEPEAAEHATLRARNYALALVERHRNDRLRLEDERDLLITTLLAAEEAGEHERARTLAVSLRHIAGRRGLDHRGEQALLAGTRAAHALGNHHDMVLLLYRLGTLHFYRSAYQSARRIWEDALTLIEGFDDLSLMRLPERGLGFLAEACGEHENALRYAASYRQACLDQGEPFALAGGMISYAYQLRIMGKTAESQEDASACHDIMSPSDCGDATPYQHIVAVEAETELARLAGDYPQSRTLNEACFALNQRYRDHWLALDCLADQAEFAFSVGERQDARALANRVINLAAGIGAPGQRTRANALLARF